MGALEEALAIRVAADGRVLAYADPRYEAMNGMFGGWTAAILVRAVMADPECAGVPSAITVNYVGTVEPGTDVVVRAHVVGASRSVQHWRVELLTAIGERLCAHALLVVTSRRETDGFTQAETPVAADPDTLPAFHPPGPDGKQIMHRTVSGYPPFGRGDTRSLAWVRELSGRAVDVAQVAFLADSYAPRILFVSEGLRMSATMTLSVYFVGAARELDAVGDDYLLTEAVGTRGSDATFGQRAQLWSAAGALIATTEQLCWYR
jgi:acyl-CoA thioesterase